MSVSTLGSVWWVDKVLYVCYYMLWEETSDIKERKTDQPLKLDLVLHSLSHLIQFVCIKFSTIVIWIYNIMLLTVESLTGELDVVDCLVREQ